MPKSERERLLEMLVAESLSFQTVPLSSGKKSQYYVDGKMVATTPEGAALIADAIRELIGEKNIDAVGGPTIGADPMLGSLSGRGYYRTFIIRKSPKSHGLSKWIEGQLNENDRKVIIIDDVATTGKSLIEAIETVKREYPEVEIIKVIVLVDRQEGAGEALSKRGYLLESIFKSAKLIEQKQKCKKAA
ncbi:MAG: orotate phosphoribosyltransferase [Deltaproteobacteria bacterium]|nr:orotate phosphoribosyltransferase [Deltaproteobacteria bacterium]